MRVVRYWRRAPGRLRHSQGEVPPDEENWTPFHWEWPHLTDLHDMNVYTCNVKIYIHLQVQLKIWVLIRYRSKDGSTRYKILCHGKSHFLNKCTICVLLYWRCFKTFWLQHMVDTLHICKICSHISKLMEKFFCYQEADQIILEMSNKCFWY